MKSSKKLIRMFHLINFDLDVNRLAECSEHNPYFDKVRSIFNIYESALLSAIKFFKIRDSKMIRDIVKSHIGDGCHSDEDIFIVIMNVTGLGLYNFWDAYFYMFKKYDTKCEEQIINTVNNLHEEDDDGFIAYN